LIEGQSLGVRGTGRGNSGRFEPFAVAAAVGVDAGGVSWCEFHGYMLGEFETQNPALPMVMSPVDIAIPKLHRRWRRSVWRCAASAEYRM